MAQQPYNHNVAQQGWVDDQYAIRFYAQQSALHDHGPFGLPHADHQAAQAHMQHEINLTSRHLGNTGTRQPSRGADASNQQPSSPPHPRRRRRYRQHRNGEQQPGRRSLLGVGAAHEGQYDMCPTAQNYQSNAYNGHYQDALGQELELLSGSVPPVVVDEEQMREPMAQSLCGTGSRFAK